MLAPSRLDSPRASIAPPFSDISLYREQEREREREREKSLGSTRPLRILPRPLETIRSSRTTRRNVKGFSRNDNRLFLIPSEFPDSSASYLPRRLFIPDAVKEGAPRL